MIMVNGTIALDVTTLKAAAETVAVAGEAIQEAAQQVVTNENVQSMFSGILQTLSDNTPTVVSEAWNATIGDNTYVALGVTAAAAVLGTAYMLNRCRTAPAKSSKSDENKKVSETDATPVASSSIPSSSNASNDGFSAEGEVGEKKSRSRSPSPSRRAVGDE